MDIKSNTIIKLRHLGLSDGEAKIYVSLLNNPMSHLEVSRKTKINRTKVYRLVDDLKGRGLIRVDQRDDGKYLTATKPENLEINLLDQENKLKAQKQLLSSVLPVLESMYKTDLAKKDFFVVSTYEGTAGLKQMLWNELKTKSETCIFAHDSVDILAGNRWAEKFRSRTIEARLRQRSIENFDANHALEITNVEGYKDVYEVRYLPRETFNIQQELTIHDDTVSIYNWKESEDSMRVGVEIKNKDFAKFMKDVFESFWAIAAKEKR